MARRLEELYALGTVVEITDDGVDENGNPFPPVEVYLAKLSPALQQRAFDKANAERAKVLAIKRRPDSTEYLSIQADVFDMDREGLEERLLADHMARRRAPLEAKFIHDNEDWNEDGYVEGLWDAWNNGLKDKYEENPEDPEAIRVKEELDRYEKELQEIIDHEEADFRRYLSKRTEDELQKKVTDQQLKLQADLAFLVEHRYCQVWLATRDPDDHDEKYFETREDVDKLDARVFRALADAYQALEVPADEGKG